MENNRIKTIEIESMLLILSEEFFNQAPRFYFYYSLINLFGIEESRNTLSGKSKRALKNSLG